MSAWESCARCEREFMANEMLQAEVRHVAVTAGESAARSVADEVMGERHAEHSAATTPGEPG